VGGCSANPTEDDVSLDFSVLFGSTTEAPDLKIYEARDGTMLPYRHYPSESGLKLVLLHGSGSHGRYLASLANAISKAEAADVFTPDLRGHGVHPVRRGDIDYIEQLEDDVADLMAHIRSDSPRATILLGGHSSGGGLALRFSGSPYSDQVSGYLLLAPFLRHDAPTMRKNSGGWARAKISRIVFLSILNSLGIRSLNGTVVIEFEMPEAARDGTETLAYSFRLNTGFAPRDYQADLSALDDRGLPLLVLVGAEDEAFVADAYADVLNEHAPKGKLEILPGQSHLGLVVGEPVRVSAIDWLREQAL
jgi:alpha-beta hydrolase superfamily lysophospholipase